MGSLLKLLHLTAAKQLSTVSYPHVVVCECREFQNGLQVTRLPSAPAPQSQAAQPEYFRTERCGADIEKLRGMSGMRTVVTVIINFFLQQAFAGAPVQARDLA